MNPKTLHSEAIVVDSHCDTLGRVFEGQRRLGEHSHLGQFDLPRALAGGLTAELMATFVSTARPGTGVLQTFQFIDVFHEELAANSNQAMQAVSPGDIVEAKQAGKVALILSMEGAEGLQGDLGVLRSCYRLGLRALGLTWNRRNEAADGIGELSTGGGLTNFGLELVQECNRLGIVIDLAHLAPQGVRDVLELSEAPVVATHANCRALWDHPRNLTDRQLEDIARSGGVVGVVPAPPFLGTDPNRSDLPVLLDHIEHMVSVMGEDGVGLGMDFDGVGDIRVAGIEDVSKLPNLTQGLVERGYGAESVRKILGGNWLRVFAAVW
jgi:membrane dipeptidase